MAGLLPAATERAVAAAACALVFGLVYLDSPPVQLGSVHFGDGLISTLVGGTRHETEAPGTSRVTVGD